MQSHAIPEQQWPFLQGLCINASVFVLGANLQIPDIGFSFVPLPPFVRVLCFGPTKGALIDCRL